MRVCMLQEHLSLAGNGVSTCGEEQSVYHLSRALAQKGVDVSIISSRTSANGYIDGFSLSKVRRPFDVFSFIHKAIAERAVEFDIIHSHEVRRILLFALLKKHKQPLIVNYRGAFTEYPKTHGRSRFVMEKADRIVCSGQSDAIKVEQAYQLPAEKIRVVPPGVDTDLFRRVDGSDKHPSLGNYLPQDSNHTILFVGGLRRLKGIETLMKSMQIVLHDLPDTKLIFVGVEQSPFLKDMVDEMNRLGIRKNCILVPPVSQSDLVYFYSAANILALPSFHESAGKVVIEALACETPVVVSKAVGFSEFVEENRAGIAANTGDHVDLARAILQLLTDEKGARTMGLRGRRMVVERLSWSSIASTFLSMYEELLG